MFHFRNKSFSVLPEYRPSVEQLSAGELSVWLQQEIPFAALLFIKTGVYGAMVRKDADFQDYRALLVDVLSKSNALDSTKDALQYIVDKGYQQRRRYEGIEAVILEAKLIKRTERKTGEMRKT